MSTDQNDDNDDNDDDAVRYATDPTLARTVIEERDGFPAHAAGSEGTGDEGALRVGFADVDEAFEEVSWAEFSEEFEQKDLAAVYAEGEDGTVDGTRPVVLRERDHVPDE